MDKRLEDSGVLKSYLQKAIRRSMPKEAIFCAVKLLQKGEWWPLLNRIRTIALEDIGDPAVISAVFKIVDWVEREMGRKRNPDLVWLGRVIILLCRAKKNREGDEAINHVLREMRMGWSPDVPDWVLDMHTKYSKRSRREEIKEFWEGEGTKLVDVDEDHDFGWIPYVPSQGDGYHDCNGKKVDILDKKEDKEVGLFG